MSTLLPDLVPQLPWPLSSRPDHLLRSMISLDEIITKTGPDVVHLHASVAGAIGRVVVRGRRPTIFQPHAWSFYSVPAGLRRPTLELERRLARWSGATICGSPGEWDAGRHHGIAALALVDNAVDTTHFVPVDDERRRELRRELDLETDRVVVSVGRLAAQKNPLHLLEAWRLAGRDDATLLLVGDGRLRAEVSHSLPANVRLLGTMPDPRPAHQVADLTVLASRYETRSLAVLEAMACGSPVVSTDVSGVADLLAGGAGTVVPQGDADALAAAISMWLDEPDRLSSARALARRAVETEFGLEVWSERMEKLYLEVIGEARPRT